MSAFKLLCDTCMKAAEVSRLPSGRAVFVRCHDEEHIWDVGSLPTTQVYVWSNVCGSFEKPESLARISQRLGNAIVEDTAMLVLYERVRKHQGAPSIWIDSEEYIDKVIDALISMRGDLKRS